MKKTYLLFMTLSACFFFIISCKRDEFVVTFNANGGTGNMQQQTFVEGVQQWLFPNAFECENYHFTGWNTYVNGGGKEFRNMQYISITTDMTLYAQWIHNYKTFVVTFYANGGEGNMEAQPFPENTEQELSANTFKRTDHIFNGWNTKADGAGYRYKDKEIISLYENLELFAQWVNPAGGGQPCVNSPTVKDIDGNTYNTVQIGSQCWMRENLRTTKYNTGSDIPIVADDYQWETTVYGAMCYYSNDTTNIDRYGALYNGYAVQTGKLCPNGWHLPSDSEWDIIANYLGGYYYAGYKMKTEYDWIDNGYENGNGNNESGFSVFPSGLRSPYFGFMNKGYVTGFWASIGEYWGSVISLVNTNKNLGGFVEDKNFGNAVRCVKD